MHKGLLASIIVITYNNADVIRQCVSSLLNQSYPLKEIIVVYDQGSSDGTEDVIYKLLRTNPNSFVLKSTPHVSRSRARNIGWKDSLGEVLFFADADDVYHEDYLEKAISQLASDTKMGGVCLTGASLVEGDNVVSMCMEAYSKIQQSIVEKGAFEPSWAWVYRREAIEKVDGFDEKLDQAEDKDLFIRVKKEGYNIGLITGINWLHRRSSSLGQHLQKSYRGGKRRILFVAKHGKWGELTYHILPFWVLLILAVLSSISTSLVISVLLCLVAVMTIRGVWMMSVVWGRMQRKQYVFICPLFSLMAYLCSAVGHAHGLVAFCWNMIGKVIDT